MRHSAVQGIQKGIPTNRSRFLGRGSDEALLSEKKGVFSEEGAGIQ